MSKMSTCFIYSCILIYKSGYDIESANIHANINACLINIGQFCIMNAKIKMTVFFFIVSILGTNIKDIKICIYSVLFMRIKTENFATPNQMNMFEKL
jgi:hypothetical protein